MKRTGSREEQQLLAWVQAELARRWRTEGGGAGHIAVLPVQQFSDEYAAPDPQFNERRGPEAEAIAWLLCGSCCGWGRSPDTHEFYEAIRATKPTPRQVSIINVLISEASMNTVALAYLQGAFSWKQLATAMERHGGYSRELAEYVNLHADYQE